LKLDAEHHLAGLDFSADGERAVAPHVERVTEQAEQDLAQDNAVGQDGRQFLREMQAQFRTLTLHAALEGSRHAAHDVGKVEGAAGDFESAQVAVPARQVGALARRGFPFREGLLPQPGGDGLQRAAVFAAQLAVAERELGLQLVQVEALGVAAVEDEVGAPLDGAGRACAVGGLQPFDGAQEDVTQVLGAAARLTRRGWEHGGQRVRLERRVVVEVGQGVSDQAVKVCAGHVSWTRINADDAGEYTGRGFLSACM